MKVEENQRFTSFDFFTLIASLVIIVGISGPIINKNFQPDNSIEKAKVGLSQISQVILNSHTLSVLAQNNIGSNGRSVASVDGNSAVPTLDLDSMQAHLKNGEWEGELGKDPWGRPYHYSFIRNSGGMHTHVAVWSDGPNQVDETEVHALLSNSDHPDALTFKGDDVGRVFPIR